MRIITKDKAVSAFFLFLLACLLFCALPSAIYGAQFACPQNSLRVLLASGISSADFSVSEGSYELVDYVTQRVISSNANTGTWIVAPKGNGNIQVSHNGSPVQGALSSLVILRQKDAGQLNVFRYKNKRYRGDLLVENLGGKIYLINVIDMEQYLYSVVGAEMGLGAPEEAYKAQAVASRTYAFYKKENPYLNYDVETTQMSQVYGGYDSELQGGEPVKRAVDATRGLVIYYDGKLIQAFFHANAGGYTESAVNVWSYNLPYIRPVPTPEDSYATQVTQYGDWPGVSYQWEKTFSRQELLDVLKKWNAENPGEKVSVGQVVELAVSRQAVDPVTREYLPVQTQSGRVTRLDIIGTNGIKSFFKDNIRSVLGLRSTLFNITFDSTIQVWNAFATLDVFNRASDLVSINADGFTGKLNGNNDNYYVVSAEGMKTIPKVFNTVTITGRGYGHGLGMSQWGAWGMAARGVGYRRIIEHFYNQGLNDGRLEVKPYNQAR
ncbi:MAG: SpoIID/LytB domain-containing protein [Peptococcaceae bacterium]|jgi:stage II sporulation protein D|nr:SpoIID/LytB domain-containing protein [Peptococcaceae bacterium]MDH7525121.1 SpoIID/LytB domain-containing protein [Peptococcaceae bacterium]